MNPNIKTRFKSAITASANNTCWTGTWTQAVLEVLDIQLLRGVQGVQAVVAASPIAFSIWDIKQMRMTVILRISSLRWGTWRRLTKLSSTWRSTSTPRSPHVAFRSCSSQALEGLQHRRQLDLSGRNCMIIGLLVMAFFNFNSVLFKLVHTLYDLW